MFSDWIVLLIVFHLAGNDIFSDGALAPFRFCDAILMFAFSLLFFGVTCVCASPGVSGLPPGVGRVALSWVALGKVGPTCGLGWAGGPSERSSGSISGMGLFIGTCSTFMVVFKGSND